MAKGIALSIGLNSVDPNHYSGWSGILNACEADASDLADIAKSRDFAVETLLTKSATRVNVTQFIESTANDLVEGDIFLLFYSGHGGQVRDLNNDEDDYMDETWCLYDGELIDDEIFNLLGKFKKGVRILVFSDSCHSGSVIKEAYYHGTVKGHLTATGLKETRYKFMPPDVALSTYRQNQSFYENIIKGRDLTKTLEDVKASALLISGCQDNQYSSDGTFNSLFTATLLVVWMPPEQSPNYFWASHQDLQFENQTPFTI
jgi:hypothetical protein